MKKKKTSSKKISIKKRIPKKINSKKISIRIPENQEETGKILIQNFVSLQKVMTQFSIKFEELTTQISKLLELFEISAKSLAKKDFELNKVTQDDERIIKKMDTLLEQNKIIARGLTLIHEKNPEEIQPRFQNESPIPAPIPKLIPPQIRNQNPPQNQNQPVNSGGYQKSISAQIPDIDDPQRLQKNAQQKSAGI
jgi:hypothetical protein